MKAEFVIWVEAVVTNLAPKAKQLVREQLYEHFAAAVENYQTQGKSFYEAEDLAYTDLGDIQEVTEKFERAYLTNMQYLQLEKKLHSQRNSFWIIMVWFSLYVIFNFLNHKSLVDLDIELFCIVTCLVGIVIAKKSTLRNYIIFLTAKYFLVMMYYMYYLGWVVFNFQSILQAFAKIPAALVILILPVGMFFFFLTKFRESLFGYKKLKLL